MEVQMTESQEIQWKPFSHKHLRYINKALKNRMCVAEGAIRSGKTIDHCVIAQMYLEKTKDRIHLATGSTLPNAKLNIGDCNGFGLEHLFRGQCRWGKYKANEALHIYLGGGIHGQLKKRADGDKIVIFAGGGKADSYKRILGNSYGLWIATEVNEHFDCDDSRTSFVKVANGRQIAAQWPFTLWDLNPSHPGHSIYKDYIDAYHNRLIGGYQYEHFTIADNLSITPERRAQIESQYVPGTVWYERDILGKRRAAEGLIYRQFADNKDKFLAGPNSNLLRDVMYVSIGVDPGGSRAKTAFVATAIHANFSKLTVIGDHEIGEPGEKGKKGEVDADRVCREFVEFVQKIRTQYRLYIKYAWVDNEAQYLVNSIRNTSRSLGLGVEVYDAKKKAVKSRMFAANALLTTGRLFIARDCKLVQGGLEFAAWDPKKPDTRLDNFSSDVDILDAFEYSWEPFMNRLLPTMKKVS